MGGCSHESNRGSPDDACADAGRVDAAHRIGILASGARSDSGSVCQAELDPLLGFRGVHRGVAAAEGSATPKTPLAPAGARGGLYTSRLASSPAGLEALDRRAIHPAPRVPSAVATIAPAPVRACSARWRNRARSLEFRIGSSDNLPCPGLALDRAHWNGRRFRHRNPGRVSGLPSARRPPRGAGP